MEYAKTAGNLPIAHFFGAVTSTFDAGFELASEGRLNIWSSVCAKSQTAGRGQLARHWASPPGNLYASIRLPLAEPFSLQAGAIAFGAFCASALREFDCAVGLKWPNDLVMLKKGKAFKVGGILLQERQGCLLAGIGINLKSAPGPDETRDGGMPAATLVCAQKELTATELWLALAKNLYGRQEQGGFGSWRSLADEMLIWRDERVVLQDSGERVTGTVRGIGENGGLLLAVNGAVQEFTAGSISLAA